MKKCIKETENVHHLQLYTAPGDDYNMLSANWQNTTL